MTEREACAKYGERLTIASLGAVVKTANEDGSVDVRVVHDGTHGIKLNDSIKILDQVAHPTAQDLRRVLQECEASKVPFFAATVDVKEAHRQIQIRPQDVALQACRVRPGGMIYVNLVGTYGVTSAGYWWARLAAAVTRLAYAVLGGNLCVWILIYVDDWLVLSGGSRWIDGMILFVLLLRTLGVPISWPKLTAGRVVSYIGMEINVKEYTLGMSARRAAWLSTWLQKTSAAGQVSAGELSQALGRLQFAYGVLVFDRPFLAALYAVSAGRAPQEIIELPPYALAAMAWLRERILARRTLPCKRASSAHRGLFRVDAKADGDEIGLGGWMPSCRADGSVDIAASAWFAVSLTPATAPWAYLKGEPFKVISALELLATTVALMLFAPQGQAGQVTAGTVMVTGHTDSAVSSAVVSRGATTAFPLCLVAMEAAAQQERLGLDLRLDWAPREMNSEADALSNMNFQCFLPSNRVQISMDSLPWLVLPRLQQDACAFHSAQQPKQPVRAAKKAKLAKLRERDPW